MDKLYYYIDESGDLNNGSEHFILGCFITEDPQLLQQQLEALRNSILRDPYYWKTREQFVKQGFHATENHPDIRAEFYKTLTMLDVRIYFLFVTKNTQYFQNLKKQYPDDDDLYNALISRLLCNRLLKNNNCYNTLIFEEYGNSIETRRQKITTAISEIEKNIQEKYHKNIRYTVDVHSKSDLCLSIIDYANYILFTLLKEKKTIDEETNRMMQNFRLIESKIALIHELNTDTFFSEKNEINFAKIKGQPQEVK